MSKLTWGNANQHLKCWKHRYAANRTQLGFSPVTESLGDAPEQVEQQWEGYNKCVTFLTS